MINENKPHRNLNWQQSFTVAMKGLGLAYRQEASVRRAMIAATVFVGIILLMRPGLGEILLTIIIWSNVVVFELFNTAMEKVLDYTSEDKYHSLIKFAKDTLAAGVFVCSVSGVAISIAIVVHQIIKIR